MSNISIYKDPKAVSNIRRPLSDLTRSVVSTAAVNRIQTNTNGTFRRIVRGEQVGKAIRGEFNAIIVAMLPKVSRTYYAGKYDPEAKPTLPDCWSNNGDIPEQNVPNRQAANCATCPQNIEGSGDNGKSKACRFHRRVALLLEGDVSGDVYQFNIPAKSLFGRGHGNTHPFESYVRFLAAHGESIDYVVTNISYDLDADTMELRFTPVRPITDDEYALVLEAQSNPETQNLIQLTAPNAAPRAAEKDTSPLKPAKSAKSAKSAAKVVDEDEDKADDAQLPLPMQMSAKPSKNNLPWLDDEDEDEDDSATVSEPRKAVTSRKAKTVAANDLAATLDAWADEDD